MPQTYVDDFVWETLDPRSGLTPRQWRRWVATSMVLGLLVVLAGFGWWSGLVRPRLSTRSFGYETNPYKQEFTYLMDVHNHGLFTVDVQRVGRGGPGLRLLSATGAPTSIPPGGQTQIALSYEVSDCGAVPKSRWPVPVTATHAAGSSRLYLHPPLITSPEAASGPRLFSGDDPLGLPWQQTLAQLACAPVQPAAQQSNRPSS